jgi:Zn-dependent protease
VLLNEQRETPFDLRFRLFGTPVRVHPFFWLVTAFMGFDYIRLLGFDAWLMWIAVVFFSILLHEFGHIWMGQVFDNRGYIVLQGFCGLAVGANREPYRWQRILVSLAGPGIQLLFVGLLLTVLLIVDQRPPHEVAAENMLIDMLRRGTDIDLIDVFRMHLGFLVDQPGWPRLARIALHFLISINLWWALINLLPVWPLDGGQVSRELFTWASPIYGVRNSLALSLVVALMVAVNALSAVIGGPHIPYLPVGGQFFIFFFAAFAFESFIGLQIENARTRSGWRDPDDDDRLPWERDPDEWKRG